jgi:glycosyltransferase involved in cell wall biosynthesis
VNEPAISVLMTVFNAGRFFEPAIKSILAQTFRDFEFLIVDDASTDGSPDVAQAWAAKDGRLRVVRNNENKGQTACLNQGLRLARGKWTARQDADDLAHPLRLAKQHQFVSNPACPGLATSESRESPVRGFAGRLLTRSITWTAPSESPCTLGAFPTDLIRDWV